MKYLKAMIIVVGMYLLLRWIYNSPQEAGQSTNDAVDSAADIISELSDRVVTFIQSLGGSVMLVILLGGIIYLLSKSMK